MKHLALIVAFSIASAGALAAPSAAATAVIQKAFLCDKAPGQAKAVTDALATLGAKPDENGNYVLPVPILIFGIPVRNISVSTDEIETYIAVVKRAYPANIAAAARLAAVGTSFVRDTPHGRLSADVRDHTDVWLSCALTQ